MKYAKKQIEIRTLTDIVMRKCQRCGKVLELNEDNFYKNVNGNLRDICKGCHAERSKIIHEKKYNVSKEIIEKRKEYLVEARKKSQTPEARLKRSNTRKLKAELKTFDFSILVEMNGKLNEILKFARNYL